MRGWSLGLLGVLLSLTVAGAAWGGLPVLDRVSHVSNYSSGTTVYLDLEITAYSCTYYADGVCLGFDGVTPGPTIVAHEGDTVVANVTNDVYDSIQSLSVSQALKDRLGSANFSLHSHGVTITVQNDGVGAHAGTQLTDSSVGPNVTRTFTLQTLHVGTWHYHDHILGPDGGEGQERGLFGSFLVLPQGESTTTFDLHLLDNGGPNSGRGMSGTVGVGDRFHILVVGLGDYWWTVKLYDTSNVLIRQTTVAPGVSDSFVIDSAEAGNYRWTAKTLFLAPTYQGLVTAS